MKRSILPVLLLSILFVSCASKSGEENKSKDSLISTQAPEKICPYDDWKHMGFGQELPEWVEVLLSNELTEVKTSRYYTLFPELSLKDIITIDISEDILDKSESKLLVKIQENLDYTLFQTFWVRTKEDQQYHSLALLYK